MAEGIWFNDNLQRRIKLRAAALLVGKEPTKLKRIKQCVTMKLDSGGESQIAGLPEWLANARDYVMLHGETISAAHAIQEVNIVMGDENLFRKTPTEAPKSRLDHFIIKQMGDSDDPDTVLCFEIRSPFSTDLWGWLGQMGGEEFDVTFELVATPAEGDLTLTASGAGEAEDEVEDATEEEPNYMSPEYDDDFRTTPLVSVKHQQVPQ